MCHWHSKFGMLCGENHVLLHRGTHSAPECYIYAMNELCLWRLVPPYHRRWNVHHNLFCLELNIFKQTKNVKIGTARHHVPSLFVVLLINNYKTAFKIMQARFSSMHGISKARTALLYRVTFMTKCPALQISHETFQVFDNRRTLFWRCCSFAYLYILKGGNL